MYENPVIKLTDEQIEQAIADALARRDVHFVSELIEEQERRGVELEV